MALSTSDFAILEGPPGSGKTYTICELILQLIKRKKRVLLCASTHIAVDNVLEKLEEYKFDFLIPLRIGDEINISEKARKFHVEKLVENEKNKLIRTLNSIKNKTPSQEYFLESLRTKDGNKVLENLFLECANLICGTTIGFLKYFNINKRYRDLHCITRKKMDNYW